jgi:hypothetical protein
MLALLVAKRGRGQSVDRELWTLVLGTIKRAAREVGWNGGRRAPRFPNWLIVAMYAWSTWHDRTLSWACDRAHYNGLFRPRELPSVSRFSRRVKSEDCRRVKSEDCRRVKSEDCRRVLQRVHAALAQRGLTIDEGCVDGKALLVGPVSKDRQATRGKVCGGFAKGYKLHAFVNERRRVVVRSVTGLNEDEKAAAMHLLPHLPPASPQALIFKDGNYGSAPLHKLAAEVLPDARLVGPLKGQDRVGPEGHHPVTLRQMGTARRELVAAWQRCPAAVELALRARDTVERVFGVLCCTAGGLGTALPPWVRTLDRVRRWVGTKVILYNARLAVQDRLRNAAAA